jgi:hypothetical protein
VKYLASRLTAAAAIFHHSEGVKKEGRKEGIKTTRIFMVGFLKKKT